MVARPSMLRPGVLKRFGRGVGSALRGNLFFKVLALVLAGIAWAWVQSEHVIEVRTRAQVQYVWPEGLVRARQVPKTLVVTVSGPQGVVRTIGRGDVVVKVDLGEAEQGVAPVDFTELELLGLPVGVEVVQVSPPGVDVELDRRLTREVEVRPTVIGDPRDGWKMGEVVIEPATVHITGPQSTVKDIAQVATDVIDVSGARGDVVVDAPVAITERVVGIAPGTPGRVKVTVKVLPIIAERTFEDVPVAVRAEGQWMTDPASARVVVSGPQVVVAGISVDKITVLLEPGDETDERTEVVWRQDEEEAAVRVAHDRPGSDVEVVRVEPRRFTVERVR